MDDRQAEKICAKISTAIDIGSTCPAVLLVLLSDIVDEHFLPKATQHDHSTTWRDMTRVR